MVKSKKYVVLGGVKVSSEQLSEWGSTGGRPRKWTSEAERKKWEREQKKGSKLRDYRSYETVKVKKYLTCPNCGKVNNDLSKYFNEQGKYISETYWFNTARMEKTNVRENVYHCFKCSHSFSFLRGEIEAKENRKVIKRAGSSAERSQRSRKKW